MSNGGARLIDQEVFRSAPRPGRDGTRRDAAGRDGTRRDGTGRLTSTKKKNRDVEISSPTNLERCATLGTKKRPKKAFRPFLTTEGRCCLG